MDKTFQMDKKYGKYYPYFALRRVSSMVYACNTVWKTTLTYGRGNLGTCPNSPGNEPEFSGTNRIMYCIYCRPGIPAHCRVPQASVVFHTVLQAKTILLLLGTYVVQ